jgi:predicted PurR-regulated permease PerM
VAALVIVLVRFLTTYPHLWALILFFAVWGVVQDYFVSPRVMSGTLELHPLAAIAAVLMGGELGGVVGVYLSIPVVAAIRIVWVRWQKYSAVIAPAAPPVPADGVLSTPKVISKL